MIFPAINLSIYKGFCMAMLNNQEVTNGITDISDHFNCSVNQQKPTRKGPLQCTMTQVHIVDTIPVDTFP